MEGLVSSQAAPISAHCFLPAFPHRFRIKLNISHIRIKKSPKSLKSIAASVQPLEASKLGHFKQHSAIQRLCSSNVLTPTFLSYGEIPMRCALMDSTVCLDEGIDEFAEFCGAGKAVAEWTSRATSGSVPFEEALAAWLSLFNPSFSRLS
ncbi:hypothetical protein FH972_004103 [Carpinus fangiana]|uniref:Uncharacterized protein n=1 Tax=Carpinus fangiana TaxID=176857 RepID=A0A5N6QK23_9ROSI|nr:hypothetical protein FH972_004103 [Carpinus fangiana]